MPTYSSLAWWCATGFVVAKNVYETGKALLVQLSTYCTAGWDHVNYPEVPGLSGVNCALV